MESVTLNARFLHVGLIPGCTWKINFKFNCQCIVISVTLSLKLWIPDFQK